MAQHGGYGPPPGGYPGAPGYGPPGPGGAGVPPGGYGAPPPKKKSNTLLFVGIGCLALLVIGTVLGGVGWYFFSRRAAGGMLATGGPVGGEACVKAIACCKSVVTKSSGDATALAACENLVNVPTVACTQALDSYKKSAVLIGVTCE
jgi:hypothetical protein